MPIYKTNSDVILTWDEYQDLLDQLEDLREQQAMADDREWFDCG